MLPCTILANAAFRSALPSDGLVFSTCWFPLNTLVATDEQRTAALNWFEINGSYIDG